MGLVQLITDKMVCEAYLEAKRCNFKKYPYDILMQITGLPEKVCYKAMERACYSGFIECGVSLRSGWLTDKGTKLISGD